MFLLWCCSKLDVSQSCAILFLNKCVNSWFGGKLRLGTKYQPTIFWLNVQRCGKEPLRKYDLLPFVSALKATFIQSPRASVICEGYQNPTSSETKCLINCPNIFRLVFMMGKPYPLWSKIQKRPKAWLGKDENWECQFADRSISFCSISVKD